jgi:MFS transporter, SP family, arabinose:H+ symporter
MPTPARLLIEFRKLDRRLILAAVICSLGGVTFGYDIGALSAVTQNLKEQFSLSPASFGLTISSSLWGTICGSLLAGRLVDRIGRRSLIAAASLLYALAAVCQALPTIPNWHLLLALRFLSGMAIGGFTVGCPLYLAEIAPIALRGRFVSLFQFQVGVGVVLGFLTGWLAAHWSADGVYWRWCLGSCAIPALSLLSLMQFMPETTEGLAVKAELGRGRAGTTLHELLHPQGHFDGGSYGLPGLPSRSDKLFSGRYTRPILLATSIAVFNQLSGVNILLLYLLEILSSAGLGPLSGHTFTVVTSCLSLVTTLLGMAYVDQWGRKPLLVMGSAGMALCLFGLAITIPHHIKPMWYLVILVAYNAFFAFSQGTIIWVYLSELFPPAVRGAGQGYGAAVHWIANAILISLFPTLQHGSQIGFFYFLVAMMILQIGVVLLWYPETKGTTLGALTSGPRS